MKRRPGAASRPRAACYTLAKARCNSPARRRSIYGRSDVALERKRTALGRASTAVSAAWGRHQFCRIRPLMTRASVLVIVGVGVVVGGGVFGGALPARAKSLSAAPAARSRGSECSDEARAIDPLSEL